MTPTETQCAWLAGLFEGEGCASLRYQGSHGPYPELAIQMTDHDVILQIQEWFGGNVVGPYQSKAPKSDGTLRKPQWKWFVSRTQDVSYIILSIRPWVKSRRGERLDELLPIALSRVSVPIGKYERTQDHRQQMSELKSGFSHTEEAKEKIKTAALNRRPRPPISEETRAKQSASGKAAWVRRKEGVT